MRFAAAFALFVLIETARGNLVQTRFGPVRGHVVTLHDGTRIVSYKGIPYAKAPIGTLRWQPPEDPERWSKTLEADSFSKMCPQGTPGMFRYTHPNTTDFDLAEDCLYLNIYAPEDVAGRPYPVMVYLHGGAFTSSGSMQYPGHFLAAKGVIVVTINYRVGHLGFMSTGDRHGVGNFGLRDQVKAFEFVRYSISGFGGDPSRVTCFGQSAGAASCGLLVVSPVGRNWITRAILQSGTELSFWAVNWPEQEPHDMTRRVAAQLNCPTNNNENMMNCMRNFNATVIRQTPHECKAGHFCQGFAPTVDNNADGSGRFLPNEPRYYRENGDAPNIPLMAGVNSEDGSLYTLGLVPEMADPEYNLTRARFLHHLQCRLLNLFRGGVYPEHRNEDILQTYNFYYTPWPKIHNNSEVYKQQLNALITDAAFGAPADATLKSHHGNNPNSYYYVFGFRSTNATRAGVPEWMGVPHQGEIPYMQGWPYMKHNQAVMDDMTPHANNRWVNIIDWNDEDVLFANYTMTLWTNFAKTGNPTPTPVSAPGNNPPTDWKPYNPNDDLRYVSVYRNVTVPKNYRQKNFAMLYQYLSYMTGLSYPMRFPIPNGMNGATSGGQSSWFQQTASSINCTIEPDEAALSLFDTTTQDVNENLHELYKMWRSAPSL